MNVRFIRESDAETFLAVRKHLANETPFLLRRSDEINLTVEQQRKQIQHVLLQDAHLLLVAEHAGSLVGFLLGLRGEPQRKKHVLTLVVGVLQAFARQGIGTQFLVTTEQWACPRGITRLELHVLTNNQAAIALYRKQGFEVEGRMKDSQYIDGHYVDEYLLAKILDEQRSLMDKLLMQGR